MSQSNRTGIECPKCGSGTYVARTENYTSWMRRVRVCKNERCRHSFDTKEVMIDPPEDPREPDLFKP